MQKNIHIRPALFRRADEPTDPAQLLDYAEYAERLGYDGIFVGDRMLADAPAGGQVVYSATMIEATTAMAALSARTRRMKVGVLVYVAPYRHPLQIAKTFASLDVLSGGRTIMGAGLGWNPKEFANLGLDMKARGQMFEEIIPLVRRLWKGESVTHHGRYFALDAVQIAPRSPQADGPPIWMASFAPSHSLDFSEGFAPPIANGLRRVGRLADGWAPLTYSASAKRRITPEHLADAYRIVMQDAVAAGRQEAEIDLVHSDWVYVLDGEGAKDRAYAAVGKFFTGSWEEAVNTYVIGTADEVIEKLKAQTRRIDRPVDSYVLTAISDEVSQLELIAQAVSPALREG